MNAPSRGFQRGVSQVLLATVFFSFIGPLAKLLPLGAGAISFWRACFGVVGLLAVESARGRLSMRVKRRWHALGLLGLGILSAGNWYFYVLAAQVSTVALAVVCLFTYPLLTTLLEPLLLDERYRPSQTVGGLLVIVGVLLLVQRFEWQNAAARGAVWGMAAAVCLSLRNVWGRRAVAHYPPATVTLYQFAAAAVVLLPAALYERLPARHEWSLLAVLGIVMTLAPHALFNAALRYLTTSTASLLLAAQPLCATLLAWWILGEVPAARTALGGALILSAVFWTLLQGRQQVLPLEVPHR